MKVREVKTILIQAFSEYDGYVKSWDRKTIDRAARTIARLSAKESGDTRRLLKAVEYVLEETCEDIEAGDNPETVKVLATAWMALTKAFDAMESGRGKR